MKNVVTKMKSRMHRWYIRELEKELQHQKRVQIKCEVTLGNLDPTDRWELVSQSWRREHIHTLRDRMSRRSRVESPGEKWWSLWIACQISAMFLLWKKGKGFSLYPYNICLEELFLKTHSQHLNRSLFLWKMRT